MLQPQAPQAIANKVMQGDSPEVLFGINSPGYAATIWQRTLSPDLSNWLDAIPVRHMPHARMSLRLECVKSAVSALCNSQGLDAAEEPFRSELAQDISSLAHRFATLFSLTHITMRLDIVTNVACPKFHLDNVPARLLCTYRGLGTEYTSWPGQDASPPSQTLKRGHVGLFRGRQWPSGEETRLLHRSPAMPANASPRLLLVIDPGDPANTQ